MLTENNEYRELIENIKTKVKAAQYRVMSQANAELIFMYREIGLMLNEKNTIWNIFL